MQSLQNAVQTQFWAVRDYLAPVLKDSKFKKHGRITPDEFVAAGDFLVYKFPTWQWEGGDKAKAKDYLPADKQYLVQRNVPCIRRVSQMRNYSGADDGDEDKETLMTFKAEELLDEPDSPGDEWVATHTSSNRKASGIASAGSIPDIPDAAAQGGDDASGSAGTGGPSGKMNSLSVDSTSSSSAIPNMDDIPDIDDDEAGGAGVVEPEDEAAAPPSSTTAAATDATSGNTLSVRTYDCSITYDKYYQVPRMWLSGLSPTRQPLTTAEIFEDVSADYASKTVTIEPFPHKKNVQMASVHPCKHSNVMKKVIERMDNAVVEAQRREKEQGGAQAATGGGSAEETVEGLRVDQYLLVFLKFLSNVVPTIELDATTSL